MHQFSVLMSVYIRDNPVFLDQAMASVFNQSYPPGELVLVKDGELTPGLEEVIGKYANKFPSVKLVEMEKNAGLGAALARGLTECSFDLVARMDADDINMHFRFERQFKFLKAHPDVALVGAWIDEFIDSTENVVSQRKVPELSEEIAVFARLRSPFNHPTVMFRRDIILSVGNYQPYGTFEDYHLWSRLLSAGYMTYNFQESHLLFRASIDMYKRRGGWKKTLQEFRLQQYFFESGFIDRAQFARNLLVRGLFRFAPSWLRGISYKRFQRQ